MPAKLLGHRMHPVQAASTQCSSRMRQHVLASHIWQDLVQASYRAAHCSLRPRNCKALHAEGSHQALSIRD